MVVSFLTFQIQKKKKKFLDHSSKYCVSFKKCLNFSGISIKKIVLNLHVENKTFITIKIEYVCVHTMIRMMFNLNWTLKKY